MAAINMGLRQKVPVVMQAEAAECGLACITMIGQYHGLQDDIRTLRRKFSMSSKGSTLKDLINVCNALGFSSRPLRLEMHELNQLQLPCILHWDMNHFVVLTDVSNSAAVINDPAAGTIKMSLADFSTHFTGVALELTPTVKFTTAEAAPRVKFFQLLGNVKGLKTALAKLFGLAGAIEVFAMLSPLFLSYVIDHAIVGADRDLLTVLALGFGLMLVLRVIINAVRGWYVIGLGANLTVQSRSNLYTHLLNLPANYFEQRHMGDIMSRFESQETILKAITTELVEAMLDGIMVIVTLALMFTFAPMLTIIVVIGAALYALLRYVTYRPLQLATNEAIVWGAKRDSHFLETLRGIRAIKLFNGQDQRRVHWLNLLVETINRQLTAQKLDVVFRNVQMLLIGGLTLLVVWLGARSVLANTMTVGLLVAFLSYKDQFLERISELINKLVEINMLKLHAERLADIALTEPEDRGAATVMSRTTRLPVSLEARNVSYRYSEHEPWVLQDLNLKVAAGESLAICGPSGGGKTTLFKLLCGLLEPSKGEILVNGQTLRHIGKDNYRNGIGVVMQDDQLFAGSIAENITFFDDRPDQELVEVCAMVAAVHDDITAMPMGYGTLIGDMGTVLSGGQKQRVLLARALYRMPGILFLDEATSHLDVEREKAVNAALSEMQMTRVAIAHRPETINAADRIVTLDAGRFVKDTVNRQTA